MSGSDKVFVAFGKYVAALDKGTGKMLWNWKIPRGRQYPAILADDNRVFVSAMGYTYCLNSETGELVWENELPGMGTAVACIATQNGQSAVYPAAAASEIDDRQRNHQHNPG